MVNSKHKGNTCQSFIAKLLSDWYGEKFRSTPASGALRWQGVIWTFGDLLPPEGLNTIWECKHYADVSSDAILNRGVKAYQLYWWEEQLLKDQKRAMEQLNKPVHPFLVWKKNQGVPRIVMHLDVFNNLLRAQSLNRLEIYYNDYRLVNLLLRDFITAITPSEFREALASTPCDIYR
jgi:hypothetical protein